MDTKVADPMRGALLGGRYRIMGRLARGGSATVYQARDERLDRPVAIKIINHDKAQDTKFVRRLTDEAKTVAKLGHPNVVAVYDQGTHEDTPYLVMEFVRGRTLREVLSDRRRLDPSESLAILEQILAALGSAHRAGLVHRDVKPENILVVAPPNGSGDLIDAVVKVADFGLAHAADLTTTDSGEFLATAEYVAPEVVANGRADARSDVYAAGVVMFEMLTGATPFAGERPADVAWQHVDHDVPAPSSLVPGLPPLVDEVVTTATRRDPAARPRDAGALLAQVQAARDDIGALAGPTRAIAHPTVVVPSVGSGARPSWARLPQQRTGVAAAARRIASRVSAPALADTFDAVRNYLLRLNSTKRGRQQLLAVLIVIGLLLLTGGWWFGFGRYVDAPPLTALTKENAIAEASRLGFTVDFAAGRFSEDIPINTVIDQRPEPGDRIVRGGVITLTLSLGPERYNIPDVAGQSVDYVQSLLKQSKFVVQFKDGYSDTLPKDYVVGTEPPAGTAAKPNSVVTVIVAKGPYPVHVPGVVGLLLGEADQQLRSQGFDLEVVRVDDQTKRRDEVLSQDPAGGQGMVSAKGVKVKLTVANGPPGVPMPSVIGMNCNDARNNLQSLGLAVDVQGNDAEKAFGHVQDQSIAPNTPIQPGQQVQIHCVF